MMRLALVALLLIPFPAWAVPVWPVPGLYEARAIVTGTRPETRAEGIITCFRRVLVKVSGDPSLLDSPLAAPFDALAATMVEDLAYQDRMGDEPHHDEQGTRDRPFDLTVHFDPQRIDATLTLMGEAPYRGPRPPVVIRVTVDDHGNRFPMTADGEADEQQREALLAASDRFGLRVVLPEAGRPTPPNTASLSGTLVWSDAAFGWVGSWQFDWPGGSRAWTVSGVSFDEAFRNALGGGLAALSGHAPPR